MVRKKRARPVTGKVCPELSDDLLRGAGAIALFLFGDAGQRRKVYYLASGTNLKLPIFRIGKSSVHGNRNSLSGLNGGKSEMSKFETELKHPFNLDAVRWAIPVRGGRREISWRRIDVETWLQNRSRSGGAL